MAKFWYKIFLTSEAGKLLKQEHLQWVSLYGDFVMYYGGRTMNVGPCHHGMARPRFADGGTVSNMEGSCEQIE